MFSWMTSHVGDFDAGAPPEWTPLCSGRSVVSDLSREGAKGSVAALIPPTMVFGTEP